MALKLAFLLWVLFARNYYNYSRATRFNTYYELTIDTEIYEFIEKHCSFCLNAMLLSSQTRYMNRHCMPMYFGGRGNTVLRTVTFSCRILPYRFSTAALLVVKIKIKKSTNIVVSLFQGLFIEWTWWHFINEGI